MSTLTKMIEAMAQAEGAFSYTAERFGPAPISAAREEAGMKAALLWLAANVTDEMFDAFYAVERMAGTEVRPDWKKRFAAALRAAAGGGE